MGSLVEDLSRPIKYRLGGLRDMIREQHRGDLMARLCREGSSVLLDALFDQDRQILCLWLYSMRHLRDHLIANGKRQPDHAPFFRQRHIIHTTAPHAGTQKANIHMQPSEWPMFRPGQKKVRVLAEVGPSRPETGRSRRHLDPAVRSQASPNLSTFIIAAEEYYQAPVSTAPSVVQKRMNFNDNKTVVVSADLLAVE